LVGTPRCGDTDGVPTDKRELARLGSENLQAMFDVLGEDIVPHNRAYKTPIDLAGLYRGEQIVTRSIERWVGTWSDYAFDVDELIEARDAVPLAVHEAGRGKRRAAPKEHRYCMAWTIADRQATRGAIYDDLAHARESPGLAD
jgi:ketosteroid isomerase-like protein